MPKLHAVLALLLVGCGGASEAHVRSRAEAPGVGVFAGCETRTFTRFVRGVDCQGTRLILSSRDRPAATLVSRARNDRQAYAIEALDTTLRVNGRDLAALSFQLGIGLAADVLFTAIDVPGTGEAFEAQCYRYGQRVHAARCASLLDGFVAGGLFRGEWPEDLPPPAQVTRELDVVGRTVRLPSSCDEVGPFELDCDEGRITLVLPDDEADLAPLTIIDMAMSRGETRTVERQVPCFLEGVAATCNYRKARLPADELWTYQAGAVVRGRPLLLRCEAKRSKAEHEPGAVCGQFFQFGEEALREPESVE